ncbi:MAG TPA: hypothetical protein DDW52_09860 [Planctomycetaceae bacterium]|nr:hypothetical protein [Planctomycetaceae bacterium]
MKNLMKLSLAPILAIAVMFAADSHEAKAQIGIGFSVGNPVGFGSPVYHPGFGRVGVTQVGFPGYSYRSYGYRGVGVGSVGYSSFRYPGVYTSPVIRSTYYAPRYRAPVPAFVPRYSGRICF